MLGKLENRKKLSRSLKRAKKVISKQQKHKKNKFNQKTKKLKDFLKFQKKTGRTSFRNIDVKEINVKKEEVLEEKKKEITNVIMTMFFKFISFINFL